MTDVMTHRGPDESGLYIRHNDGMTVGLGHRRLSIIDLTEAGRQPLSNEDGSIWLVFNGEIYNYPALRKELEGRGHRFRSATDSEVIIHLYEEEGIGLAKRLAGMFAFAIWDEKRGALFLCRDRIGIKPLVYYHHAKTLVFASEIKAILASAHAERQMDWQALELYLTFNYIPAPRTIFRNIRKVLPGHYLCFCEGSVTGGEYWDLGTAEPVRDTQRPFEEQKKALFEALDAAVRSHMIADVPVGAFLSGGIDSSIIVGLMSRHATRPVKTFSIGFADMPLYDETAYARAVARRHGTEHHETVLSSRDVREAIPAVLASLDEPFADSSAVPTFIVSRQTAQDVKVALSGDGGDELFAGYRLYTGEYWHDRYNRIPRFLRQSVIASLVSALHDSRETLSSDYVRRAKKFLRGSEASFEKRFFLWNEIFSRDLREQLMKANRRDVDFDAGEAMLTERLRNRADDPINRMLYTDLKVSLPGDMLKKVDQMSMLHSLEVRVPFLDHDVCELAFSICGNRKLRNGKGKFILRETFKELLPESVIRRSKRGFEMPLSAWLRNDLGGLIDDCLGPERIHRQGIFDPVAISRLVETFRSRRSDASWQLWSLIAFQVWYETYMVGRP
jgi:asparagine synthase (glutamine-hydrolysing)